MRILIADDDLGTRLICKQVLEKAHHEVYAVENGQTAWQTLEKTKIDLILCDLNMPGMPGMELIEKLPKDPRTKDMRVIVFTADATRQTVQKAVSFKVAGYVLKPLVAGELLAKVEAQTHFIPIILEEWHKVQKRLGVELRDYKTMVHTMLDAAKKSLSEMQPKLEAGSQKEVAIFFNGLKSGATTIGALGLARACGVAEKGITKESAEKHLKNVEAEVERLEVLLSKDIQAH